VFIFSKNCLFCTLRLSVINMRTYYNKNPNLPKFYFDLDLFKQQQKLKKEDPITVSPVDSSDYDFLVPEEDDSITTVLQIPQEKEMENVVEKKKKRK